MRAVLNHRKSTEPDRNWNELINSFAEEPSNFQHRRRVSQGQQGTRSLDSPLPSQGPVLLITAVELSLQITQSCSKVQERRYSKTLNFILINFSLGLLVGARICWRETGAHSAGWQKLIHIQGCICVHKTRDDPGDHGKQHDLCLTKLSMTTWIILTVGVIAGCGAS